MQQRGSSQHSAVTVPTTSVEYYQSQVLQFVVILYSYTMTYSQYYIFDFLTDTGTQVWLLQFVSYPLTLHVYRCYYTGNKRCCYSPSMMQTLFHSVTGYCVLENLGLNE